MKTTPNKKVQENSDSLKTLSKDVSEKLIKQIINGVYPAGSKLPTEREMAKTFQVTRNIVREALKRVETLRLIKIRQGSGAVVQDYKVTGGIELVDLLILKSDGKVDKTFLRSVMEFHVSVVVYTIKLATQRITKNEIQELRRLVKERTSDINNSEQRYKVSLQISKLVVKASRNMYIQLVFNSLIRNNITFEHIFGLPLPDNANVQKYFEQIMDAMERKDHDLAAMITSRAHEDNYAYIMKTMEAALLKRKD
jgi:DNA-binding FadR family transcriptional regulator